MLNLIVRSLKEDERISSSLSASPLGLAWAESLNTFRRQMSQFNHLFYFQCEFTTMRTETHGLGSASECHVPPAAGLGTPPESSVGAEH